MLNTYHRYDSCLRFDNKRNMHIIMCLLKQDSLHICYHIINGKQDACGL